MPMQCPFCSIRSSSTLFDQAQLARIDRRLGPYLFHRMRVVVVRIELADQAVQRHRRFVDVHEEIAAGAIGPYASPSIHGGIVTFVPGAAAGKTARSDFQGSLPYYTLMKCAPMKPYFSTSTAFWWTASRCISSAGAKS